MYTFFMSVFLGKKILEMGVHSLTKVNLVVKNVKKFENLCSRELDLTLRITESMHLDNYFKE